MNGLPYAAPLTHLLSISWGRWYIVTFYHTQRRGRGVYVDLRGCFGGWIGWFFGRIGSGRFENPRLFNQKRCTESLFFENSTESLKLKKAPRPAEAGRGAMFNLVV